MKSLLSWLRSSSSSPKQRGFRPEVEPLDARLLLSSSGVLSSITDAYGHTTAFAVGTDQKVYAAEEGSAWTAISIRNETVRWNFFGRSFSINITAPLTQSFKEVSAALDGQNYAVTFALDTAGHLWEMAPREVAIFAGANGASPVPDPYYPVELTHISGGRYGDCYGIDATTGALVHWEPHTGFSTVSPGRRAYIEVSAAVDRRGSEEVYALDTNNQVWLFDEYNGHNLQFTAAHISAGIGVPTLPAPSGASLGINFGTGSVPHARRAYVVTSQRTTTASGFGNDHDVLYATRLGDNRLFEYDGFYSGWKDLAGAVMQVSAGLDANGLDVCYGIGLNGSLWEHNATGWHDRGGRVAQISAAAHDLVFAVTPGNDQLWAYDPRHVFQGWKHDNATWYFLDGNSADPSVSASAATGILSLDW